MYVCELLNFNKLQSIQLLTYLFFLCPLGPSGRTGVSSFSSPHYGRRPKDHFYIHYFLIFFVGPIKTSPDIQEIFDRVDEKNEYNISPSNQNKLLGTISNRRNLSQYSHILGQIQLCCSQYTAALTR